MTVRNPLQNLRISHTMSLGIIISSFLIVNIFLFLHYGVKIVNDTARYLEYSDAIMKQGIHFEKHNFWYLGYVLFITFFRQLSDNPGVIIFAQVSISLLAPVAIYYASWTVSEDKFSALFSALLYIFWLKISQWNFYIHPESLYVSFSSLTICSVVVSFYRKNNFILSWLLVAVTFWIKPTGFVVGASLILSLLYVLNKKIKASAVLVTAECLILGIAFVPLLNAMLATFNVVETYATGEIIYAYSTLPDGMWRNLFIVENNHLNFPTSSTPLGRMVDFIFHNLLFFSKITALKGITFLLHVKPYFSPLHNAAIILILYPAYWFSYLGIKIAIAPVQLFITAYIILHCVIVMLTVEDWDGRFILPLLPVIFIFAGNGVHQFILTRRNRRNYGTA